MQTTHLPGGQITFCNVGLTQRSAKKITFEKDGKETTVADYIERTYHMRLAHADLPCVIQRKPQGHESYYPIELLKIV